jgi:hypothetical protein
MDEDQKFQKQSGIFDDLGESDPGKTPSPLADPVLMAIFQDVAVSGLAMKSLLNANLADSGDVLINDVQSVTPQRVHTDTSGRGYRIDVEATTVTGEIALFDVQLSRFVSTVERSMLYAEQALASRANRGDTLHEAASKMPRVVVLNILNFVLRQSGRNFHQIADITYREEPRERATEKFEIHNLELPRFRKLEPNFKNPLHCWLTAVCRAQEQEKPMKEVVEMDTNLKEYYDVDPGFAQFVDRHGVVAASPEVRKAYRRWQYEQVLAELEAERLKEEGKEEGKKEGKEEGRKEGKEEGKMEIALNAFAQAKQGANPLHIAETLRSFGVPEDIIHTARKQYEAERR